MVFINKSKIYIGLHLKKCNLFIQEVKKTNKYLVRTSDFFFKRYNYAYFLFKLKPYHE